MRLLILFSALCCVNSVYSQVCGSSSCPGGRIEYRKTGKFCCYDKEETVCTKIIRAPYMDEAGDEERLFLSNLGNLARPTAACPANHPVRIGGQCCNRAQEPRECVTADEMGDEMGDEVAGDEDRRRCPRRFPFRIGFRCCNRRFRPRWCIFADEAGDEMGDEVGDEMGDEELGDEVAGDEDRRRCPRRYRYRVGNRCCNRPFRPRQCIFADE